MDEYLYFGVMLTLIQPFACEWGVEVSEVVEMHPNGSTTHLLEYKGTVRLRTDSTASIVDARPALAHTHHHHHHHHESSS